VERNSQLERLYERYVSNSATPEEVDELMVLINEETNAEKLMQLFDKTWDNLNIPLGSMPIKPLKLQGEDQQEQATVIPIRKMRLWVRIAVAASIVFIVGIGSLLIFFNRHERPAIIARLQDVKPPVTNRATITLANGQRVYLDSAAIGQVAVAGNVIVSKKRDGQIVYSLSGSGNGEIQYNTLTNPRGSKVIDMTLADGSRVWLNAESSLKYPVSFAGNQRKVEVSGEAYFEVAHDASRPFKVGKGQMEVAVLGTHFNVNAYDDDADIKVTLLEGSVKILNAGNSVIIKPGQQAQMRGSEPPVTNKNIDLDEVMAWRQGWFHFESADLQTILKQYARWYDIQVIYEGPVSNERYFSIMSRSTSLSDVLKSLQANNIKFRIEGRKLFVISG
jgi:transmembrane sensor